MNTVDLVILLGAGGLGLLGAQAGLVAGLVTMGGFAGGALLGARLGPLLLSGGSESAYAPLTALVGALVLGAFVAAFLDHLADWLRARLVRGTVGRAADGLGGGVLFAGLGLALAWVLGAVALNTPGLTDLRAEVQRSKILSRAYEVVPPQGELLGFLNRIDPTPSVRGPAGPEGRPPRGIAADPDVVEAGQSVVRVIGSACGLGIAGSGWVARGDLVVTNAHVVAGQDETTVETRDGATHAAEAVFYQPRNDLAILRVGGVGSPPLRLGEPEADSPGAVLGYPRNGPFVIAPARLGEAGEVRSSDSYGRGPVTREMTPFRGRVMSGNSGGPVVGADGRVLTTVFAASVGSDPPEGLGVPNEIVRRALRRASSPVDTGPCAA